MIVYLAQAAFIQVVKSDSLPQIKELKKCYAKGADDYSSVSFSVDIDATDILQTLTPSLLHNAALPLR